MPSNSAVIAGVSLSFSLRGSLAPRGSSRAPRDAGQPDTYQSALRDHARRELARVEQLESDLARDLPEVAAQAVADFDFGSTAGPGAGEPAILALLLTDDPVGRVADLISWAVGAKAVYDWIRRKGGEITSIDDGVAVLYAADAIQEKTGDGDLTLLLADQVVPPHADPWDFAGYRVAFGDAEVVHEVFVTRKGEVREIATLRPEHFKRRHREALSGTRRPAWMDEPGAFVEDPAALYADPDGDTGGPTSRPPSKKAKRKKRRG